jgi:hypothetical protein
MGTIYNFDKIQILPFKKRIADIAVTNFYMDGDVPKPVQSHLDIPPFSYFEIVKYQPNSYYGNEDKYEWENDYALLFLGEPGGYVRIHKSCFESPETMYVLASWKNINDDKCSPDLQFVGSRPFELSENEQEWFWELARIGQSHISVLLEEFISKQAYP